MGVGVLEAISAPSWDWAWAWAELGNTEENAKQDVKENTKQDEKQN